METAYRMSPRSINVELEAREISGVTDPISTDAESAISARLEKLQSLAKKLNSEDAYEGMNPHSDLELPQGFLLSVVVPVYNEQDTIRQVVARLLNLPLPTEIIVVDDGSDDSTRDELKHFEGLPRVQILSKPQNEGKGAAVRDGLDRINGTVALIQDADLEYDPRDIPGLLRPILNGEADIVFGSRFRNDQATGSSRLHRFGNRMLTSLSNLTTGLKLTDMETCYKLIRRESLERLELKENRFGFEPEITAKLARRKFRITELPIRYNARAWDQGKKIGFGDGLSALYCILRYAWFD